MTTTKFGAPVFRKFAAVVVGLVSAIALMLVIQTAPASAADPVANPGTFTVTFATNGSGDGVRFSNSNITETRWPMNSFASPDGSALTFQINVSADGTFTATTTPTFLEKTIHTNCLTGAFLCIGAPSGVRSTPQKHPNFNWGGTIDPATGFLQLNMPMRISNRQNSGSTISDCYLGSNTNPINIAPSTSKSNGVPYDFNTGTARVADAGFTTPGPTNAAGGAASENCVRTTNWDGQTMNVPSTDTWFRGNLTILNGQGEPVRPWPVRPSFNVSPDPVGVGEPVTFNASASAIENGLQECPTPDVSDPDCGYRWDFDGDGTVDEVTNTPTVTHAYGAAGNKTPKLTIFDTEGKSDTFTGSVWVQQQPVVQIDTTPPVVTKETSNVFEFSIPSNPYGATTLCSVDGAAFSACNSGDTFNFTQDDDTTGSHNFRVRGITPGGVIGPIDSYDFTIDRVKPRVTIAEGSKPADPTNVTSANFTFTADKPGSTLECQLDGGPWEPCGTNSSGSKAYSGLTEEPNPHQFRVRATDPLGNIGGDGNPGGGGYDWRVDLTAPVPSFTEKPAQPSNVVSPLFTWTSDEPVQLAQCRLKVNGAVSPWNACQTLVSQQFTDLEDADYEFAIRVLDIAGNWSEILSHAWLLETVAPNLEITSGPPELSTRSLAQFFYDHEDGVDLECQLDDREVQNPCPSGTKYAYLDDGAHFFTVTATDAALNFTTRTHSWSVKTSQPAVQIEPGSVPASSSTVDTAEFELVTVNGDAECRLDGGAWEACESNEGQSYSGLADGNHTFEVRAVDEYGNVSAIDAYSWLVVTAAPEVTITSGPASNTKLTSASFGFEVESADPTIVTECSLDGESFACSDPASVVGLEDGDHTFTVTATDTAGIQGHDTYEWRVKAKIPGLGFDEVPNALSNTADATFAFSSDEDPDVAYECKLDAGAWEACESPVSKTGLGQGNHTFSIRATDPLGNAAIETYQWNVDTVAPTVTFGSKPAATTSDVAEIITFTASEGGATFECSLDDAAFTACASPTLLKGLAKGVHSFRVRATDETGNQGAVATANWTINGPAVAGSPSSTQSNAASVTAPATQPKSSGNAKEAAPKAKTTAKKAKKAKKKSKKNKRAKKAKKARSKR